MPTNLTSSTREYWDRTVQAEVYMRLILVRKIIERRQMAFKAGTAYKATVDIAEIDDLAQEYGDNEPMTSGSKTFLDTVLWRRKRIQIPLKLKGGEELDNNETGGGDGQIVDLEDRLVAKGQRAMRLKLNSIIYRAGSSARDAEGNVQWQGIPDALTHNITYGGLTRAAATTNPWWQGASLAGTYTDQSATITPTVDNVRRCIDAVTRFVDRPGDLLGICGSANWRTLQSQIEGQRTYKEGDSAKYGFRSFSIDDVEIVAEPYLDTSGTLANYFFMLHLPDWFLRLSRKRKLGTFTGFKWQGDIEGGKDEYLGRVLLAGNLMCIQPNASIFLSGMTG